MDDNDDDDDDDDDDEDDESVNLFVDIGSLYLMRPDKMTMASSILQQGCL